MSSHVATFFLSSELLYLYVYLHVHRVRYLYTHTLLVVNLGERVRGRETWRQREANLLDGAFSVWVGKWMCLGSSAWPEVSRPHVILVV